MREGRPRLLAMTPVEFLRRWGLLMPPPHKNLIQYYRAVPAKFGGVVEGRLLGVNLR